VPAVDVRGLTKRYGGRLALDRLDLVVEEGSVHGLLGPNGAGKTTLMRVLFGLVRPDAGTVALLGREPGAATGGRALDGVSGFPDAARFYPYLSARDNLALLADYDGGAAPGRVDEALARVRLTGRARDRVGGFSTGLRQRLGLAAALLRAPRLLVVDEPASGLDPVSARELRDLVAELAADGVTVLLSSHDMQEVDELCDEVTVLRAGQAAFSGPMTALREQAPEPGHRLVTSDDRQAAVLAGTAGVLVGPHARGGLAVRGTEPALDRLVLALGTAGVAVRALEPGASPLESLFRALTAEGADRDAPAVQQVA